MASFYPDLKTLEENLFAPQSVEDFIAVPTTLPRPTDFR